MMAATKNTIDVAESVRLETVVSECEEVEARSYLFLQKGLGMVDTLSAKT